MGNCEFQWTNNAQTGQVKSRQVSIKAKLILLTLCRLIKVYISEMIILSAPSLAAAASGLYQIVMRGFEANEAQ